MNQCAICGGTDSQLHRLTGYQVLNPVSKFIEIKICVKCLERRVVKRTVDHKIWRDGPIIIDSVEKEKEDE